MNHLQKYELSKQASFGAYAKQLVNLKSMLKGMKMNPKSNIFTTGKFSGKSTPGRLFPDEEGIRFLKEQKNMQRILAGGGDAIDKNVIMAMNPNYHMAGNVAKINPAYTGPWGKEGLHNPLMKYLFPKAFRKQRELFEPQIM